MFFLGKLERSYGLCISCLRRRWLDRSDHIFNNRNREYYKNGLSKFFDTAIAVSFIIRCSR